MKICEKETNIKKVCYSAFGHMPFPLVRFQAISDYFFSNDSALITVYEDKFLEAYKVFQYDFSKVNAATVSYSVYELRNGSRKEFIVRIVEWDRNAAKKQISEKRHRAALELSSEVYYIHGDLSAEMRLLLRKIRACFQKDVVFEKKNEASLANKVFVDYYGFSKTLQWGSPFSSPVTEEFLNAVTTAISLLTHKVSGDFIPKVEFLFDLDPREYEKMLL